MHFLEVCTTLLSPNKGKHLRQLGHRLFVLLLRPHQELSDATQLLDVLPRYLSGDPRAPPLSNNKARFMKASPLSRTFDRAHLIDTPTPCVRARQFLHSKAGAVRAPKGGRAAKQSKHGRTCCEGSFDCVEALLGRRSPVLKLCEHGVV